MFTYSNLSFKDLARKKKFERDKSEFNYGKMT